MLNLAVAGCRAVAAFMRERLLEHVNVLAAARAAPEPGGGVGAGGSSDEADEDGGY